MVPKYHLTETISYGRQKDVGVIGTADDIQDIITVAEDVGDSGLQTLIDFLVYEKSSAPWEVTRAINRFMSGRHANRLSTNMQEVLTRLRDGLVQATNAVQLVEETH